MFVSGLDGITRFKSQERASPSVNAVISVFISVRYILAFSSASAYTALRTHLSMHMSWVPTVPTLPAPSRPPTATTYDRPIFGILKLVCHFGPYLIEHLEASPGGDAPSSSVPRCFSGR